MITEDNSHQEVPNIADVIAQQGFFICNFESDGYLPAFSYTIGLHETCSHPELLTMGLSMEMNSDNLIQACELVKDGQAMKTETDYADFLNDYPIRFLPILKEHMPEYFGYGLEYYNFQDFSAMQLVWPSKSRWTDHRCRSSS